MLPNPNDEIQRRMRLIAIFAGLALYIVVTVALWHYTWDGWGTSR